MKRKIFEKEYFAIFFYIKSGLYFGEDFEIRKS